MLPVFDSDLFTWFRLFPEAEPFCTYCWVTCDNLSNSTYRIIAHLVRGEFRLNLESVSV